MEFHANVRTIAIIGLVALGLVVAINNAIHARSNLWQTLIDRYGFK
jgi:hypothetical protein